MMEHGSVTEFAPVALSHIPREGYTLTEKAFPVTDGGFKKTLRFGIPLVASTGIGFALGGPIGAVVSGGVYEGTAFIKNKKSKAAQKLAEAQQQLALEGGA